MTTLRSLQTKSTFYLSTAALLVLATGADAGEMTLEINNVESAEGNMRIAVYDNEADFEKRSMYRTLQQPAVDGMMEIVLKDIPAGEYGVMLFQDVNDNGELDANLLGIPNQPWSASLQGRSIFGAPGWKDIVFVFPEAGDRIVVDMQ